MLELVAQGSDSRQRWRHALEPGATYVLGRDVACELPVPWDPHVSRRHVQIRPALQNAEVVALPKAANPVFFEGQPVERCDVPLGGAFVLGTTVFRLERRETSRDSADSLPVEEVAFDRQELQKVRFRDANDRIDVLSHLPEVIWEAKTEDEFLQRLCNLVLAGIPHADAVAIVDPGLPARIRHWERRRQTAGGIRPSTRLINEAVLRRKRSIMHVWDPSARVRDTYTAVAEFDWAFCTPVFEKSTGWGLYVAGKHDRPVSTGSAPSAEGMHLQADVKFAELVAEIIASVRRKNELERQQAGYRQFFAPAILAALGDDLDTDLLAPRQCDVTVMFCDLRGFSKRAEHDAANLLGLLDRVSRALGVMTDHILKHGGVTGDFLGDAALAFWGWPFSSDEAPLNACRAALAIRAAFQETQSKKDHPLADFRAGIGIAHGRAVAGKIGTKEQVKFTVFGPVANLASRLEGMTKQLRVPILLDEATSAIALRRLDPAEGRLRKLARVLPYGLEKPVLVHELLPSATAMPELTDAHIARYERGVDEFNAGDWEEAYVDLKDMPAGDRAQDFLMLQIAQGNRIAPPGWDGIVRLPSK